MSVKVSSNVKRAESSWFSGRGTNEQGIKAVEPTTFRRALTDLSKEMYAARIQEMKKAIDEQGERLTDRVDVKEYQKYRRLIQEFIGEIVSNGYSFRREDAYASRGRHRYIATVRVIDDKLHKLGREVMKDHADRIEILNRVDDIRGLLMDLMM
ncbi:MAG: YaaR family protein [Oscillospiraceae bacterium]|nr:YaaR family protein [Oscillospiraceae bacterium]